MGIYYYYEPLTPMKIGGKPNKFSYQWNRTNNRYCYVIYEDKLAFIPYRELENIEHIELINSGNFRNCFIVEFKPTYFDRKYQQESDIERILPKIMVEKCLDTC